MKKEKPEKFSKEYFSYRKRNLLLNMLINFAVAMGIFILGLALNKWQARNIFTVIAILFVLPIARSFTVLITILPYKPVSKEDVEKAEQAIAGKGMLLYESVFTSSERAMHLSLIALQKGHITAYDAPGSEAGEKKHETNMKEAKKYIDTHLKNQGLGEKIVIYDDIDKFINSLPDRPYDEGTRAELETLKKSMEYFVV